MKLNFLFRKYFSEIINDEDSNIIDEYTLIDAGMIVKNRRKELGIDRFNLSSKTLISPYILEAIENGWINKLPEKAYLSSMLDILEKELDLPKNSLLKFLKKDELNKRKKRNDLIANLDIFYTWKGNLIYILIMAISLFSLNYLNRKSLIIEGISMLNSNKNNLSIEKAKGPESSTSGFFDFVNILQKKKPKWIEMKIKNPVNLSIQDNKNQQIEVKDIKGNIRFKITAPIVIRTTPALAVEDLIKWGGQNYIPKKNNNGVYRFE